MWDGTEGRVKRRHVFFVAGYHPMTVDDHFRVFNRELRRFASVWSLSGRCVEIEPVPVPTGALWHLHTRGPDWETRSTFEVLAWDDLARADMARPLGSHISGSVRALADMVASGTLRRYFQASRRYGLFFVFTYLVLLGLWALAMAAGGAAGWFLLPTLGPVGALAAGVLVTLGAGFLLLRWPGRRLRLKQSLDLAEFSVDYVRGRHPEVDARVADFARRIAAVAREEGLDEVVIAGHSLGAMHVVSAVAEALRQDKDFGRRVPVRLLTLGSTTAKFALHPAGGRLRAAAAEVAAASWIGWLEIQSRDDMVSFYKVNPVTLARAQIVAHSTIPGDFSARPLIRHVAIRDMLTPGTFRRFRFDMMRLHCQCFLACDKRAFHDFYAYVCGPVSFDLLAANTSGLVAYLKADGGLRGSGLRTASRASALPEDL